MGLIRKSIAVSTLGVGARYRSKDERERYNARLQRRHQRAQTVLLQRTSHWTKQAAQQQAPTGWIAEPPADTKPGWHDDPYGEKAKRWWDGTTWTKHAHI